CVCVSVCVCVFVCVCVCACVGCLASPCLKECYTLTMPVRVKVGSLQAGQGSHAALQKEKQDLRAKLEQAESSVQRLEA
ncbi:unnamed protein product, partial [Effrenium voratum]